MSQSPPRAWAGAALSLLLVSTAAYGQMQEDNTVRESINVFGEIMSLPAEGIPRALLSDAHAVAIIPRVLKGSFVVGARHGNGVLLVRDDNGGWHAPVFISLTGGNIGWQIGVQSTDVILVFKTRQSVNGLLSGKFTLGADAAVAAGPLGREAAVATDGRLGAQIYSYSRSRGLFAGVSFDGSVDSDGPAQQCPVLPRAVPGAPVAIPDAAQQLAAQLLQYTGVMPGSGVPASPVGMAPQPARTLVEAQSEDEAAHVRDELANFARELYQLLDPQWQTYLALPAEVFYGNGHPSLEALQQCLARFETVRTDPRFGSLANHPEFQSTYGLLKHYIQALSQSNAALNLPPPPAGMGGP